MDDRARLRARCRLLIAASWLPVLMVGCGLPGQPGAALRPVAPERGSGLGGHSTGSHPLPADEFMHSVAARDGALGWRQLCPQLQRMVTQETMRTQADGQRTAEAGRVARIRVDFVGSRTLRPAGQIRFYMLTADMADGSAASRVYIVRTRATGCVDGVQVDDLQ